MLPQLELSLQFAPAWAAELERSQAAGHRAALARHVVRRALRHALESAGCLSVRIVGEVEGRHLNSTYRKRDYATDVLTFDYDLGPPVQADVVLCAPVVHKQAQQLAKPLQEHYVHLLVHGALHAQGWDHEGSARDARRMQERECAIMLDLGFADPYAD